MCSSDLELLNSGTLEVEEAHLLLTPPLDWTYVCTPDTIEQIAPGEKVVVDVELTPPQAQTVGEYDVRIEAKGHVDGERVDASEKDITVRIVAQANLGQSALILVGVLALVIGAAVVSIKASRR